MKLLRLYQINCNELNSKQLNLKISSALDVIVFVGDVFVGVIVSGGGGVLDVAVIVVVVVVDVVAALLLMLI